MYDIFVHLKLPAPDGKMRLTDVAVSGGKVAKAARTELENRLGYSVISPEKASDYLPNPEDREQRKLE